MQSNIVLPCGRSFCQLIKKQLPRKGLQRWSHCLFCSCCKRFFGWLVCVCHVLIPFPIFFDKPFGLFSSTLDKNSINASYSLYWDIVMDWGMMQNPSRAAVCAGGIYPIGEEGEEKRAPDCTHHLLRPRLRFGLGISVAILVTDTILRFSWLLRFFNRIFPSEDTFVLCSQFLEVFRYVSFCVAFVHANMATIVIQVPNKTNPNQNPL